MRRSNVPELALGAFLAVNTVAMLTTRVGQTIPFHFIWISLTVVYGYRTWSMRTTIRTLLVVCAITSLSLLYSVQTDGLDPAELAEVPLMAMVYLANMVHVRRREAALLQVQRFAQEQKLHRENERNFLLDASHLLRTPVTIARGYTELLQSRLDDADMRADAAVILRELDSMSRISSRLLLLTSTNLGDLMVPTRTDLADLIEQAGLRWPPTTHRSWVVEAEECEIMGDAALLESALDALIENAVRHTAKQDRICLRCRRHGNDAVIEVADSGVGIEVDLLPKLFDRKWHASVPGLRSGTGLGLAIVKAIVTAHRGTVEASASPNGGATFTLRLPLAGLGAGRAQPQSAELVS